MDEKFKRLSLNLQFFGDDDPPADNPPANENGNNNNNNNNNNEVVKRFTQEDLNRINIKGKNDELKRILKVTGFESEEALVNHLAKVKDYDEQVKCVNEYKAKEVKNTYLSEIRKNNVADEYVDTIYLAVPPLENEKVEDYNKRVSTYLEGHKAFLKVENGSKFFNSNYGYNGTQYNGSGNQVLNLADAVKEKLNKK